MFDLTSPRSGEARGPARAVVLVGMATMSAAWAAIWPALIGHWAGLANLPFPVQWLLTTGAAAGASVLARSGMGERAMRVLYVLTIVIVALLVAWLAGFPGWVPFDPRRMGDLAHALNPSVADSAIVVPLLTAVGLLWLGGQIGVSRLDEHEAARFFALGLGGLFSGLAVGAAASGGSSLDGIMGLSCAVFFGAALLTLPLAQMLAVRERNKMGSAGPAPFDRRWIPTVVGAVAAILIGALVLSAAVSGALLGALSAVLNRISDLLAFILLPLAYAMGYLAEAVIWFLRTLFGRPIQHRLPAQPGIPKAPKATHLAANHPHLPVALQTALSAGVVAAIVLIVVLVLARSMRRIGAGGDDAAFEEERQSVWSWEAARRDLGALLGRRRGRPTGYQEDQRLPPRDIRQAYRRLLRREAVLGRPRRAMDTPHEFVHRLSEAGVAEAPDARTLTAAYVRERYGAERATGEETAAALTAWASFEATSRESDVPAGRS